MTNAPSGANFACALSGHFSLEAMAMATLLEHADKIREEFSAAFADKRVSLTEILQIVGVIVGAAVCALDKLGDKSQFASLVSECEALYSELLDPAKIDIPKVPEWAEGWVIDIGRQSIRPLLEKLAAAMDETI